MSQVTATDKDSTLLAGKFADAKPAVLVLAPIFAIKFAIG
jgi:hypothetical protein